MSNENVLDIVSTVFPDFYMIIKRVFDKFIFSESNAHMYILLLYIIIIYLVIYINSNIKIAITPHNVRQLFFFLSSSILISSYI